MGIDSVSGRNRLLGTDASRLPVGVGSPAEIGRLAVTPVGRDCWRNWVRALAVVVLTAVVGLLTTSSAFAVATSGYDASPYAYDAPARLSSPDTVADGRGSPAGTTATSWASPVSVGGRGVAAETEASLLARANAARDAELDRLTGVRSADRPATVVGAHNIRTGEVAVGSSSRALRECAEACAVRSLGGQVSDIRFTQAMRPNGSGPPFRDVPVCAAYCEPAYGRGAFPDPLTRFQSGL